MPTATPTAKPTPTAEPLCRDRDDCRFRKITTIGKGQSPTNNPNVSMVISGFICEVDKLSSTAHRIKVCSGERVTVAVRDTSGPDTVITAGGSLTCDTPTGLFCEVFPVVTEKFKVVSSDGKDTDRMTLLPKL